MAVVTALRHWKLITIDLKCDQVEKLEKYETFPKPKNTLVTYILQKIGNRQYEIVCQTDEQSCLY